MSSPNSFNTHVLGNVPAPNSTPATEALSQIDPALPGGQTPPPAPHVLLIDRLVQRHRLTAQQKNDLFGLYQVCTRGPTPLSHSDTMGRIYVQACQYGSERRIVERLNVMEHQAGGVGQLQGLLTELAIRLEDSWTITAEQKKTVRQVCQEQIYLAGRTNFKTLALDVDAAIKLKPAAYRLENIIGRQHREAQLNAFIRAMCSNVRNTFRQELKRSLFGKKKCAVEKFVTDQAARYNLSRSNGNSQAILIQNVLLRRFAREHTSLLEAGQEELEEENINAEGNGQPPQKKQKPATGRGRVADGQDFWSKVDEWFEEKVSEWGDKFSCDGWSAFIDESTQQDQDFINTKKSAKASAQTTVTDWNVPSSSTDPSSDEGSGLSGSPGIGGCGWLDGI